MDNRTYQELQEYITSLPVIDCHEHTYLPGQRPQPLDLWTILRNSDVGDDLVSAGMPAEDRTGLDWPRAAPYLPAVQNTGFHRSLVYAFRDLFDFGEECITEENGRALSQAVRSANARPDWYEEVLQRKGNIERVLRVQEEGEDPATLDRRIFAPLVKIDAWVLAVEPERREILAEKAGGSAHSLSEYLETLERAFEKARGQGAVGAKSMLAYHRSLAHSRPERPEAERLFRRRQLSQAERTVFEDFMMHAAAGLAGSYKLPLQIHAGYGSWQSNITAQANPLLLNPLIESHRQTKFVMLHGGYPFIGEMATLAKNHPNVFIEAGWLAYIAPAAYSRAMGEWLDCVPANKITAFGADCVHVEQTYGALLLTRRSLARCLSEKFETAEWDIRLCKATARRLLSENAYTLYAV